MRSRREAMALAGLSLVGLWGCASQRPDRTAVAATTSAMPMPTAADIDAQSRINARSTELLAAPLSQDGAVEVALLCNPTLATLFEQLGIAPKDRVRLAHVPDPRHGGRPLGGEEPKIERALTANLMSWLAGAALADAVAAVRLSSSADRAGAIAFDTRRAWVDAVGAAQRIALEGEAVLAAEALRDIVRRQVEAGNRPLLAALEAEQASGEAQARRAQLQAAAQIARERLFFMLGLFFDDADKVQIPRRLPELPESRMPPDSLEVRAVSQRLDVQVARVASTLTAQAATALSSAVVSPDGHVHLIEAPDEAGMRARFETRSAWTAYAAAHEQSQYGSRVAVPLAERISAEQLKRYNGMLIGVEPLLADAAKRARTKAASLEALQRFWRAEIDLQQALAGAGRIDLQMPETSTH